MPIFKNIIVWLSDSFLIAESSMLDEQPRYYKLLAHDETKRPEHIQRSIAGGTLEGSTSNSNMMSSDSELSIVSMNNGHVVRSTSPITGKRMAMMNNRINAVCSDATSSKKVSAPDAVFKIML